jgi:hypothetical protein
MCSETDASVMSHAEKADLIHLNMVRHAALNLSKLISQHPYGPKWPRISVANAWQTTRLIEFDFM